MYFDLKYIRVRVVYVSHIRQFEVVITMNVYLVGFLAVRHEIYGSLMIRALVSTMYKHASHHHMCEIFKNVSSLLAYYLWKKN